MQCGHADRHVDPLLLPYCQGLQETCCFEREKTRPGGGGVFLDINLFWKRSFWASRVHVATAARTVAVSKWFFTEIQRS